MIKILYAASNNQNAKLQLLRFVEAVKNKPYIVKIAAYKNSSPDINIDWTLDSLLNIFDKEQINLNNDNYGIYFDQIKYYNPDLIISDLEYFTSYAANLLDITLWQCSSSIINFAFTKKQKYNMSIFKQYSYIFNKNPQHVQRIVNILDNSNCKFIYSHFGDSDNPPEIQEGYEWVRPYFSLGKNSINCQHNIVVGILKNNKNILKAVKKSEDVVVFSEYIDEYYDNLQLKSIYNQQEYFCNLKNSKYFICEGQTSFLADAFYNGKKPLVITDYNDTECIINSTISEKLKFSKSFSSNLLYEEVSPVLKDNIYFLDQKIDEYL